MNNAVIDCLMTHRSIRKYKPQPIEPEKMDLILRAGVRAASAGNLQQYVLFVVDDPQKKRQLWDIPEVDNATIVVAAVDEYRIRRWLELNGAPFYFDQAVNLFIGCWDATIALQNMVLAAESLGLGTVYVGLVLSIDLQKVLGAPQGVFPAGMICLGYPDEAPDLRPRLPLEAVVHYNSYQLPSDDDVRRFYEERDRMWETLSETRRQKLEARGITNWAQRVTLGHYTPEFIAGESQAIWENLRRAGFRLPDGEASPGETGKAG